MKKSKYGNNVVNPDDAMDGVAILARGLAYLGICPHCVLQFAMMFEEINEHRKNKITESLMGFLDLANPKVDPSEYVQFENVLKLKRNRRLPTMRFDPQ